MNQTFNPPHPGPGVGSDSSRFTRHLPILAAFVLRPWLTAFLLLSVAGVASLFSIHYGLSLVILTIPFFAYYLERNMLERVLLPPFSIFAFWEALGAGIGIGLITFSREGVFDPSLLKIQLSSLIILPVGWCFYRLGFGKIPRIHFPDQRGAFERDVVRPLVWVGWFFLIYTVLRVVVMAKTGHLDRGEGSAAIAFAETGQVGFGMVSLLGVFPRFNFLAFFLIPLIWRYTPRFGRLAIPGLLAVYFIIVLVSGSRGILFYPIIFMAVGFYFFRAFGRLKLDLLAAISLIALLPLIVFIDAFRNTDAYKATRTIDVAGRLAAFDDALARMQDAEKKTEGRARYETIGAALLGRSDYVIYEFEGPDTPRAGFERFRAVLYTFAPTFLVRNKPVLVDSNLIYWDYLGRFDAVGRGMGLAADSYRRFGWIGVPVVAAFFFWLYGFICGRFYRQYLRKDALLGILLVLIAFSFFQFLPFSSVLETWWHMSYSLLKHVLALLFGCWALRKILNVHSKGGLHDYMSGRRG